MKQTFFVRVFRKLIQHFFAPYFNHLNHQVASIHAYNYAPFLRDDFNNLLQLVFPKEYPRLSPSLDCLLLLTLQGHAFAEGNNGWTIHQELREILHTSDSPDIRGAAHEKFPTSPSRLKILFVCGMFPSVRHAGGLRLFDLISSLSQNHDVYLFSLFDPQLDQESHDLLKSKLTSISTFSSIDFTKPSILVKLQELNIDHGFFNIIHFEYNNSVRLIEPLRPYGGKTIFTFMECTGRRSSMDVLLYFPHNSKKLGRSLREMIENIAHEAVASRLADITVALTTEDSDFVQKYSTKKPKVLPSGVSEWEILNKVQNNTAPYRNKIEGKNVTFLGYFDHYPNLDGMKWYLEFIHPIVKKQVKDYTITIAGDGNTSELKKLTKNDSSVIYTGRIPDITKPILSSRVCISPLISGAGFRGKINQYSALHRPTVSTRIGTSGTPYEHERSVLIADQPEQFAKEVIRLLTDDTLWDTMQREANEVVLENFVWDKVTKKLESFYYA